MSEGIRHIVSKGIGHCMSHPGSTHKNNLPGSQNKSLTDGGESLDLKRGASHTYTMKKTYYTKTDGGEFVASHIGFDQMSDILASAMADQMRDIITKKIEATIDGIDIDQKVREAIESVDPSDMAEEAIREAIEDMVSNNLSVDVSI